MEEQVQVKAAEDKQETSPQEKEAAVLDAAIARIDQQRADLGAISNRLSSVVDNNTSMVTNTESSKSHILDTDFAVETTKLTRTQILQQAATSMLAQANASKQSVLALLQNLG